MYESSLKSNVFKVYLDLEKTAFFVLGGEELGPEEDFIDSSSLFKKLHLCCDKEGWMIAG